MSLVEHRQRKFQRIVGRWCHSEIIFISIGQSFFIFGWINNIRGFHLLMNLRFNSCLLTLFHYFCVYSASHALMWPVNDPLTQTSCFNHKWLLLRSCHHLKWNSANLIVFSALSKEQNLRVCLRWYSTRKYTLLLCRLSTNPFHSFQNGILTTNKTQIAYYTLYLISLMQYD